MLLNTQMIHSTDTELLAVLLGNRKTAETLLRNAKGSLFTLLHQTTQERRPFLLPTEARLFR